jgi:hypothetical protein
MIYENDLRTFFESIMKYEIATHRQTLHHIPGPQDQMVLSSLDDGQRWLHSSLLHESTLLSARTLR